MTFSITARCARTGHMGVAVASRFFAAGAVVPQLRAGAAVASQAFVNPLWGIELADRMNAGEAPSQVLQELVARDDGAAQRQAHAVNAKGVPAAFTGGDCVDWAGHLHSDSVSVAGNMLVGPRTVAEMLRVFKKTDGNPLPMRLLLAMQAGEAAGGDKRGRQSACLRVHQARGFPVDRHPLRRRRGPVGRAGTAAGRGRRALPAHGGLHPHQRQFFQPCRPAQARGADCQGRRGADSGRAGVT